MGEWMVWLILGSLVLVIFCIYSLSSQLERCVHLAVEIITGNQRKILEQLENLSATRSTTPLLRHCDCAGRGGCLRTDIRRFRCSNAPYEISSQARSC